MKSESSNNQKQTNPLSYERISETHNRAIAEMGFPSWLLEKPCLNCQAVLKPIAIRGVELKTNAQFLGNIAVSVLCQECKIGYVIHFKSCCHSVDDLVRILKSPQAPSEPEKENYGSCENNLMEIIYKEDSATKSGK